MEIKPKESAKFDIVSLGEVMLRLDPGEDRIRTARSFRVWEGGGEYNVARGLRKCFGLRAGSGRRFRGLAAARERNQRRQAERRYDFLQVPHGALTSFQKAVPCHVGIQIPAVCTKIIPWNKRGVKP